jgi:3-phenylpropionate/trans-cinnamate dioxygenase ferredoxin reductase component
LRTGPEVGVLGQYDVVIVGSGHAGAHTAVSLRQRKFTGTIALVSDEMEPPYERPPLSKDYLGGERNFERMLLRPAAFWSERAIALHLGHTVVAVNAQKRVVETENGRRVGYGTLVWAAGGQPRKLTCPGADLPGVHTIRRRSDVDLLRRELADAEHVAIVGGGYIGLEVAATLRKQGKRVTVIEALDRVLARVAGEPLSRFYESEHRAHGATVLLRSRIECVDSKSRRAACLRIEGGRVIEADLIIVGVGITPVCGPLLEAGAECENGVVVDEYCRTTLPDVYAIGDCALQSSSYAEGLRVRLESVQNACDMALTVARAITGEPAPHAALPWFWSNQYDLRLQTAGLSVNHDDYVIRGEIASRTFSVIYLRKERVIALDCVNAASDFIQGKSLVLRGVTAKRGALADTRISLKEIAAAS